LSESPLAQGRGLELRSISQNSQVIRVASRAGAWIGTADGDCKMYCDQVASRAGAWIGTIAEAHCVPIGGVASRAGAWIGTLPRRAAEPRRRGRLSRRGVDWNVKDQTEAV